MLIEDELGNLVVENVHRKETVRDVMLREESLRVVWYIEEDSIVSSIT